MRGGWSHSTPTAPLSSDSATRRGISTWTRSAPARRAGSLCGSTAAGAITDGCSAQLGAASLSGFDGGCLTGCLGIMVIAFIGAPFFLVSACDRFFRLVLRSRVDVSLAASGPDTVASFAFHGPGGYSLRRRYARAFEKPVLPASLGLDVAAGGQAGDPPPGGGPSASGRRAGGPASGGRPAGGRHASGNAA